MFKRFHQPNGGYTRTTTVHYINFLEKYWRAVIYPSEIKHFAQHF